MCACVSVGLTLCAQVAVGHTCVCMCDPSVCLVCGMCAGRPGLYVDLYRSVLP